LVIRISPLRISVNSHNKKSMSHSGGRNWLVELL
jgi:hypothetical protein